MTFSLPDKVLVFCAAKTAGTSLSNLLSESFGAQECLRELQHLEYSVLGHIHRDQLETFLRQMPQQRYDAIRLLVGHLPIDIGNTLRSTKFHYAGMFRESVARMVSSYFYINQQKLRYEDEDYLNGMLHRHISIGRDVVYANPLTRLLTGSEALVPRAHERAKEAPLRITRSDFELARDNLRHFAFVGLTERLEDSVRMLFARLGRSFDGRIARDNATAIGLRVDDLHPDTTALLQRSLALDRQLYSDAVQMFGRHAAAAKLPPFEYEEPVAPFPAPISSGDQNHLSSSAAALSDRDDGVWIAADGTGLPGEWIGMDFGSEIACENICLQLPPDAERATTFQLEASSDEFQEDIAVVAGFAVPSDGTVHQLHFDAHKRARFWRVLCQHRPDTTPLTVAYLKFNVHASDSPRRMHLVLERIRCAHKLAERLKPSPGS